MRVCDLSTLPGVETPPLALVPFVAPDEPARLVMRVRLFDGEVHVVTEEDGGYEVSDTNLGDLLEVDLADVPVEHRGTVEGWAQEEREARRYGQDCQTEAMERY